jgi:hypothetical protein
MIFELVPYKKILDQKFVNENLMPFNENEQIDHFHATVWANALLKNPYSKEVYWGWCNESKSFDDACAGGINAKINDYISKMTKKYPDIKIRFCVHKWLETDTTAIFNENAEPYVTD